MFDQDRQRELPGASALIAPLESELREPFDVVMFVQTIAIYGDNEAVDGTPAFVDLRCGSHQCDSPAA
jgi:hypothetical protein